MRWSYLNFIEIVLLKGAKVEIHLPGTPVPLCGFVMPLNEYAGARHLRRSCCFSPIAGGRPYRAGPGPGIIEWDWWQQMTTDGVISGVVAVVASAMLLPYLFSIFALRITLHVMWTCMIFHYARTISSQWTLQNHLHQALTSFHCLYRLARYRIFLRHD